MLYSTDRILTTHAGSLPRPPDLWEMVVAKANDLPFDQADFDKRLKLAVSDVIRQAECGIDCVNDGELSKTNFTDYVRARQIDLRRESGKSPRTRYPTPAA